MWQRPKDDVMLRGYMVGYGEGVPDVNWQYVDANTNSFTIKNLSKCFHQLSFIQCFTNYINIITLRTKSNQIKERHL